jgi:hypothetical protein
MTEIDADREKHAIRRLAARCGLAVSFSQDRGRLLKLTPDGRREPILAGKVHELRTYLTAVATKSV